MPVGGTAAGAALTCLTVVAMPVSGTAARAALARCHVTRFVTRAVAMLHAVFTESTACTLCNRHTV